MNDERLTVKLVFADSGAFHHEELDVPASVARDYERLIDGLQEDPELLKRIYLDVGRLCAAWVVSEEA
jgi:hypothetical protein